MIYDIHVQGGRVPDLLATTGDYLRLWEYTHPEDPNQKSELLQRATLANVRKAGQVSRREFHKNAIDQERILCAYYIL